MKISICIPTYNQANYLEAAIRSSARQTLKPFEIIVSNDCSTDNTVEILARLQLEFSELKVFNQPVNLGITQNVNFCLKLASSEFIIRLDSDDILAPDYAETMLSLLLKYPESGYGHSAVQEINKFDEKLKIRFLNRQNSFESGEEALKSAILGYKVAANIVIFRKIALEKVNYIMTDTNFAEDYYLTSSISAAGFGNVYIPRILASYRVWNDAKNVRSKRKLEEIKGLRRVFEDILEPAFIIRGWNLKKLFRQKANFACTQADALSFKFYSNQEKKELKIELLKLSDSFKSRTYVWMWSNGFGFFLTILFSTVNILKMTVKKIVFNFKITN